MFRKILVAAGGAEDEHQTVPVVTALAKAFDSDVLVVHARERVVTSVATIEAESVPEAFQHAKHVAKRLVEAGVRATSEVDSTRPDRVAHLILEKAKHFKADLIVVGGHHAHGLKESLFGDMGKVLAHGASCPVLFMPSTDEGKG
jgi:nucleotide-binding universal stress UspA family protein